MTRVCTRMGCGKQIASSRYFCGARCRREDKGVKLRTRRTRKRERKCRLWILARGRKVGILQLRTAFEVGKIAIRLPAPIEERLELAPVKAPPKKLAAGAR